MNKSICRVGVVGAGIVGGGIIELLLKRTELLRDRSGIEITLAKVAEKDRARALATGVPAEILVDDFNELTGDPEIDLVVELIGGTGIAETVVRAALEAGKPVVTANKALLAEKGKDLFALARQKGLPLAFEAAVCGGIPIIQTLREGLVANRITSLLGIVNGTCNYILSEMIHNGSSYVECLKSAQELGYAEADPTFDVEGIDSGHKLTLLSALAFDSWMDFKLLHIEGVSGIDLMDVAFAQYLGYTVKLLAVAKPVEEELFLSVHPALLHKEHPLANVMGSMNAIELFGDVVEESMFYGRGAGRYPTSSAVIADIVNVARTCSCETGGPHWIPGDKPLYQLGSMENYHTRYYLRFLVEDEPGALGRITTVLGVHNTSISSVHQFEEELKENQVPISILTHEAREGDILSALDEIGKEGFLQGEPVFMRIEG